MPAVSSVLVIGAGTAGAATAIFLAREGIAVDLIDVEDEVTALGSGISLQGNALRVLRQLGVLDEVLGAGYPFDTLGLRVPDDRTTLVAEIPAVKMGGPDLPSTLGMLRPDLARILVEQAARAGARVRFARSASELAPGLDGVNVIFTDGAAGRYDLVVGADGIRSATRRMLGIEAGPRANGMGIWRVYASRPAEVTRTDLCFGGRCYIAGFCPTSASSLYAYLVEPASDPSGLTPAEQLAHVRDLASAYHGPWDEIRALITDPSQLNYTWFTSHLVDVPWNRGRVVLIGDAAHSAPPTHAQGAAMALEDAAVLSELLVARSAVDDRLWEAFTERRHERVRQVVASSNQLCQWLLDGVRGDVPGAIQSLAALVSQPA